MATDIDVINAALGKLGAVKIAALGENSPAGTLSNDTYADIRDSLLREYPWNFATQRIDITVDGTAPIWEFEFKYVLPATCLLLLEIENPNNEQWRNEGREILTDIETPLSIRFIGAVAVDDMDSTFREALAARLAFEWAQTLTQDPRIVDQMAQTFATKLRVARGADGHEDRLPDIKVDSLIDARF